MPLTFGFSASFLPPFQFHPSVLPSFFLLFVQSLVRSIARSFVRSRFIQSFVRSLFNRLFARSIVRSIVRYSARLFVVQSLVRLFVRSFVRCSIVRLLARSPDQALVRSFSLCHFQVQQHLQVLQCLTLCRSPCCSSLSIRRLPDGQCPTLRSKTSRSRVPDEFVGFCWSPTGSLLVFGY